MLGDSERKLVRGLASQADALILDLEDAVAPSRKALAQGMAAEALAARAPASGGPQLWVRINPMDMGGLDDLAAVVRAAPDGIMVPKVDGPADVLRLGRCLDVLERRDGLRQPTRILPVATETARSGATRQPDRRSGSVNSPCTPGTGFDPARPGAAPTAVKAARISLL